MEKEGLRGALKEHTWAVRKRKRHLIDFPLSFSAQQNKIQTLVQDPLYCTLPIFFKIRIETVVYNGFNSNPKRTHYILFQGTLRPTNEHINKNPKERKEKERRLEDTILFLKASSTRGTGSARTQPFEPSCVVPTPAALASLRNL